ncbi:cysteine and histidine-rich domain-containing protein 1-like [Lineus longissimus]|uniref:cysteine and histidine-rich domain-containing protein 1-like n=1 Tax=Lineus longissimus TaxID=88925 RepID=UPI002B4F3FBC
MSGLLKCYNKGCGSDFDPKENTDDSCQYHPGVPEFHDAYKSWTCCKKRSTDFTEFLNFPGCTRGSHNNVKPPEPQKQKPDPALADEVITVESRKPKKPEPRPPQDEPMIKLEPNVSKSAIQALEKKLKQIGLVDKSEGDSLVVTVGTTCKNGGCKATYENEKSDTEVCVHHPGSPIFHEGLKYWSCCTKRTTDFEEWQKQVGCKKGKHVWIKRIDESTKKVQSCRFDFYQTGTEVCISFYAKTPVAEKCSVELNRVSLKVYLTFDAGTTIFEKIFILSGVIDPARSKLSLMGTKVEISLRKLGPEKWPSLELSA